MKREFDKKEFARPGNEYRIAPFWFLNDHLNPAEMRRQVREFAKKGTGGAFMHGRFGLRTPYFSKDWWKCISAAVSEGKKLGFNLWVYDEMNWASGWAHGRIYEENPDFQEQHLDLVEKDVTGPLHFVEWVPPNSFPEFIYVCKPDYSGLKEVTKDIWDWQLVTDIPEGPHKVLFFVRRNSGLTHPITRPAHIDRLNIEATKAYIRLSHEEYRKRFSKDFGRTIPGVFTDEPGFYHNLWNCNPLSLTWTKTLPAFFRKRRGYDLKDKLICLWKDTGDYKKARGDFYDTVAEMFCSNYFKPIQEWAKKNNLRFTGHLEWEEGFANHIQFSGHLMKPLRLLDMPGLDKIDRNKRRLTEKFVSSASHLSGKTRTLSETYACSSWDLTLDEMKAVCDWQYARGVDFLNPHAFYYSIRDERKFECHPSEGHNNIFWPFFKTFADYAARLSYILTRGRHRAPVALYYPIHTAWSLRTPDLTGNEELNKLSDFFDDVGHALMENQIDFDIVDDGFIESAKINAGCLEIAGERFPVVMLAGADIIPGATMRKLREFARKGGQVVVLRSSIAAVRDEWTAKTIDEAVKALKNEEACDVILEKENREIKYLRRAGGNWDLYFIINENEKPAELNIKLRGDGRPYILDAETGKTLGVKNACCRNGWLGLGLKLPGYGSRLVLISEKEQEADGEFEEAELKETAEVKNWVLSIRGKEIRLEEPKGWETLGFEFYSGKAKYSAIFNLAGAENRIMLDLGDVKEIAKVKINGKNCGTRCWRPFVFDITKAARAGGNSIEVEITNTQKNEFEKFARPSGLFGPVRILINV